MSEVGKYVGAAAIAALLIIPELALAATVHFQALVAPNAVYNTEITEIYSGAPDQVRDDDVEYLVGTISGGNFRVPMEFGLSEIWALAGGNPVTINSVSVVVTTHASATGTGGDITLNLYALDDDLDESVTTWNTLNPDGGDTSVLLGTQTFDPATTGLDVTYASNAALVAAVQAAVDGDGAFRSILVSTDESQAANHFTRLMRDEFHPLSSGGEEPPDTDHPELIIDFTINEAIPEPSTGLMASAGLGAFVARRRRVAVSM